ncbi:MAG: tyrosine-type recombinase/integrase [Chloroflexaceae bacterium]|nr:tyrosine-type recombinase/integrase [Chloroflexaceae bacterium]
MSVFSAAVCTFLKRRANSDCTPGTLRRYESELNIWQQWRKNQHLPDDLTTITTEELQQFFDYLRRERIPYEHSTVRPAAQQRGLSANSRDGYYRTIRAFINWCIAEELVCEQCIRFARIPRPKIIQIPRQTYSEDDIDSLIQACDECGLEARYRNRSIIFLLLESGIRVKELCELTDELVDLKKRRACIQGKGGKYRYIFWFDQTAEALDCYLQYRQGSAGGALFRSARYKSFGALTTNGVRGLFMRLSQRSGVHLAEGAPIHALRHTFAHRMLEQGADISQVSQMLGHSSIEVTMRYLRESPTKLQQIYERIMNTKD